MLILLIAGCSSGSGASRAGSTTLPLVPLGSGPAPAQNSSQHCTQADLDGPPLTMPPPQIISSSVFFRSGIFATLDPAIDANPRLAATDAWNKFTHSNPLHARQAELMLGTFSTLLPYGPKGPHNVEVLAWVLQLQDLAYPIPATGHPSGGSGASSKAPPVCEFVDAVLAIDAMTGAVVVYSY